jgi:NAD(P)-dependent dehydrogenase (short-subunit alcohol dehydrogenase family)
MHDKKVIVIAAGSDIGAYMAEHYIRLGAIVYGTYRSMTPEVSRLQAAGAILFPMDINSRQAVDDFVSYLKNSSVQWDIVISAPGLLAPIGPFFELNFDEWARSVMTNSLAQLRVLHSIYGLRTRSDIAKVIFFAGGGTNSAFDNYSAYCIGKLVLIKMTELLDSESADLKVSIIGTGWINTKIHQQTLMAGKAAGNNFIDTMEFLESGSQRENSLKTIAECLDWCLKAPRSAVGGRNISMVHDNWRKAEFVTNLQENSGTYKLRRYT